MIESHGDVFLGELKTLSGNFNDCFGHIERWIGRVLEELIHAHENQGVFRKMRENLQTNVNDLVDPDSPFNETEAYEWSQRLDSPAEKFEELQLAEQIREEEQGLLVGQL